ncbi:translocation/assembly module TamB domain-containing protein [Parapedomonas caeni]
MRARLAWLVRALGRLQRYAVVALAVFAVLASGVAAGGYWLDTPSGRAWLARQLAALETESGLAVGVGGIRGSLFGGLTVVDLTLRDPEGVFARAPSVAINWSPLSLVRNRLIISSISSPTFVLERRPVLRETPSEGPLLPEMDISIGRLRIDRLVLEAPVTGADQRFILTVRGGLHVGDGRVDSQLRVGSTGSADRMVTTFVAEPERDRLNIDARIVAPEDGALASLLGLPHGFRLTVAGKGSWQDWRGRISARYADEPLTALVVRLADGRLALAGDIRPVTALPAPARRLLEGPVRLTLTGEQTDRRLVTQVTLVGRALEARGQATLGLDDGALDKTALSISLPVPSAIDPALVADGLSARLEVAGRYDRPALTLTADARRLVRGGLAFTNLRARTRLAAGPAPSRVLLDASVASVRGLPEIAEPLTRDLRLLGVLTYDPDNHALAVSEIALDNRVLTARGNVDILLDRRRYEFSLRALARGLALPPGLATDIEAIVHGSSEDWSRAPRVEGVVSASRLRGRDPVLANLLGRAARLDGRLALSSRGDLSVTNIRLAAAGLSASGSVRLGPDRRLDGRLDGRLADLSPFGLAGVAQGPVGFSVRADGDLAAPRLVATARLAAADFAGQRWTNLEAGTQSETLARHRVTLTGSGPLGAVNITSGLDLADGVALRGLAARFGALTLRGDLARPVGQAWRGVLAVSGAGLDGRVALAQPRAAPRLDIDLQGRDVRLPLARPIAIGRLDARGALLLEPAMPRFVGRVEMDKAAISRLVLDRVRLAGDEAGGNATLALEARGTRGLTFDLASKAELAPGEIRLSGAGTVGDLPIRFSQPLVLARAGDGWRLLRSELTLASGTLAAEGAWTPQDKHLRLQAANVRATVLELIEPNLGFTGRLSGTVEARQLADRPMTANADLAVDNLRRAGLVGRSAPMRARLVASLDATALKASLSAHENGTQAGSADVTVGPRLPPATLGQVRSSWLAAPLAGRVAWNGRVEALWALIGHEGDDIAGPVMLDARLSGTLADPRINGHLTSRGLSYENLATGFIVDQLALDASFTESRLEIASLAGRAGKDGKVSATGWADLSAARGFPADVRISLDKATLMRRDDVTASASGDVRVTHGADGGLIAGALRVNSARLRAGGAQAVDPVPIIAYREVGGEFVERASVARASVSRPLRLDLAVKVSDKVFVEGLGLDSEWRGNLEIGGTTATPLIAGRLDLVRGTYEFAGRNFDLDRGQILFQGASPPNPLLNIVATHALDGTTVTITIEGTARKPRITFSSSPSLPQDEILSRILFGTSITNLSAPEALQLGAALAALRGDGGLNVVGQVRKAIGIDRLRVSPGDRAKGIGTTVTGGKYLTNRVYMEVSTDGSGYTSTLIEVDLTRTLSILSQIGSLGTTNVSLKWSKDY